ncbi:hypothetical protein Tco_0321371 [Tanacetum coccineum]
MRIMRDVKTQEEVHQEVLNFLEIDWLAGHQRSKEARQYQLQRLNTSPCLDVVFKSFGCAHSSKTTDLTSIKFLCDKEQKTAISISKLKAACYLDFGLEELVPSLWFESERDYDISAAYGITHWWFRRKQFYINKHSEPSDREAVRSQMRILSVIRVKTFEKYGYNYLREIILRRADYKEYKISEKDFKNLHPNDFEDLYLLNIQDKLKPSV